MDQHIKNNQTYSAVG